MGLTRGAVFPSKYICKEDVLSPLSASIANVYMEDIQGDHGMEKKAIMSFTDTGIKCLILNNTNWGAMEDVYGENTDGWVGRPVEIFVDPNVMFGGKKVGGVRIRVPNGAAPVGAPAGVALDYAAAVAACVAAGVTKDQLVAAIKAGGHTKGYNPVRDTPTVHALIAKATDEANFGPESDPNDLIPFN